MLRSAGEIPGGFAVAEVGGVYVLTDMARKSRISLVCKHGDRTRATHPAAAFGPPAPACLQGLQVCVQISGTHPCVCTKSCVHICGRRVDARPFPCSDTARGCCSKLLFRPFGLRGTIAPLRRATSGVVSIEMQRQLQPGRGIGASRPNMLECKTQSSSSLFTNSGVAHPNSTQPALGRRHARSIEPVFKMHSHSPHMWPCPHALRTPSPCVRPSQRTASSPFLLCRCLTRLERFGGALGGTEGVTSLGRWNCIMASMHLGPV